MTRTLAPYVFATTLFLSAALLFSVQLVVGKMVLPALGGTPAVWNTCLFFFQSALLLGYLLAHLMTAKLSLVATRFFYLALLVAALVWLPFVSPSGSDNVVQMPVLWLLRYLSLAIGFPFVALACTAPLLQRWYAGIEGARSADPYFLYAASNLGSLIGLLSYPFLLEPRLTLTEQSGLWRLGFMALLVAVLLCTFLSRRARSSTTTSKDPLVAVSEIQKLRWIALAALSSSLMVSVTNYVTTNIAPVPLLWIVPLGIYLLTFVIAFAERSPFPRAGLLRMWPLIVLCSLPFLLMDFARYPWAMIALHLSALFFAATVCHLQLYKERPQAGRLTEYYLWLSLGGAVGSAFNTFLAPLLFADFLEYPIAFVLTVFLLPGRLVLPCGASALLLLFGLLGYRISLNGTELFHRRNFFGVKRVLHSAEGDLNFFFHGRVIHGVEDRKLGSSCAPLAYFHRTGPVGDLFETDAWRVTNRIAVVGLGVGAVSCYSQPEEELTFYEIDPMVETIARDPRLFSFVKNAPGTVRVVLGDGRKQLEAAEDGSYALIMLDAFSSDAVPTHLLTKEALALYLQKLAPGGVLMFNITNSYVDLLPLLASLAQHAGLAAIVRADDALGEGNQYPYKYPSRFVVLARTEGELSFLAGKRGWSKVADEAVVPMWTDDFSNLAALLKWPELFGH